jgi:hypothetical protein
MSALRVILPVVLGIVAAVLNFLVIRGSTAPVELTVLSKEVKADTELTEEMLESKPIRADKEMIKSLVPYSDRGQVLGRRVTRQVVQGELLLLADVQNLDEQNIQLYLQPGEMSLTIPAKRVARGLRRGDMVGVWVTVRPEPAPKKTVTLTTSGLTRALGPFRLLSVTTPVDPYRGAALGDGRLVVVAVKPRPKGQPDPDLDALQEAMSGSFGRSGMESGVQSVEYYRAK